MSTKRGVTRALVIVNVQNDFFEGGAMPVPHARRVVDIINTHLRPRKFDFVILCREMRSCNDTVFCSNNPGTKPLDVEHFSRYGAQKMIVDVCVRGTYGCEIRDDLVVDPSDICVETGTDPHPHVAGTSNALRPQVGGVRRRRHADLGTILSREVVTDIYICGLSTEHIANETVRSIRSQSQLKSAHIYFVSDASRGMNSSTIKTAHEQLKRQRVIDIVSTGSEIERIPMRKPSPLPPDDKIATLDSSARHSTHDEKEKDAVSSTPAKISMTQEDVSQARDEYYEHFIDELEDDFTLVELIMERRREQLRHPRRYFPPLPTRSFLRDHLGLGNMKNMLEFHETSGMNAVHAACKVGDFVMLDLILSFNVLDKGGSNSIDLQMPNAFGDTALLLAVQGRHKECFRALMHQKNARGKKININWRNNQTNATALMLACNYGDLPVVKALLKANADSRFSDRYNKTALMYACESNTDASVAIITAILGRENSFMARRTLVEAFDVCRWSCLHYAARSGVLARFPWELLGGALHAINELETNALTEIGVSLIHIAAWAGHHDVLKILLAYGSIPIDIPQASSGGINTELDDSMTCTKLIPNDLTRTKRMTELDLALMANHMKSAQMLCRVKFPYAGKRGGYMASKMAGKSAQHLLEKAALATDLAAVEGILRWDQNKVRITRPLIELTRKMQFVDTCTFTFAAYNSPMKQPIWHCGRCQVKCCVVCRYSCHLHPDCEASMLWKGDDKDEYCECSINTSTCCALKNTGKRSIGYVPRPIDTSHVKMSPELDKLAEMIAINVHETWSQEHIKSGWRYHPDRDNTSLLHNCLLPYGALSEQDKQYDRTTSLAAISLILALGYKINPCEDESEAVLAERKKAIDLMMIDATVGDFNRNQAARSVINEGVASNGETLVGDGEQEFITYIPRPLDTSSVEIDVEVADLIEFMSKNAHANWAQQKLADGYKHASNDQIVAAKVKLERLRMRNPDDTSLKEPLLNAMLVPYEDLKEEDKEKNRATVRATIKTILFLGFSFEAPVHTVDLASLTGVREHNHSVPAHHHKIIEDPSLEPGSQRVRSEKKKEDSSEPTRLDAVNSVAGRHLHHITTSDKALMTKEQLDARKIELLDMYLMTAARNNDPEIIDMLVRADEGSGARVNAQDKFGHYPLYMAAKRGHMESIEMLLGLGADPKICDQNGFNTLHLASYLGNLAIVRELVMGTHSTLPSMDPTCKDAKHQLTPLHIAAYKGHVEVCRYIANELRGPGKKGVDIWPGKDSFSPKKRMKQRPSFSLMHLGRNVIRANSESSEVKSLIKQKATSPYVLDLNHDAKTDVYDKNIDVLSTPGSLIGSTSPGTTIGSREDGNDMSTISTLKHYSPLAVAVKGHQSLVCKVLIDANANPNLEDGSGKNPYDRALRLHSKLCDRVSLLSGVHDRGLGNDSFLGEPKCWVALKQLFFDVGRKSSTKEEKGNASSTLNLKRKIDNCYQHVNKWVCCCCVGSKVIEDEGDGDEAEYFPIQKKSTFRRSSIAISNDPALQALQNETLIASPGQKDSTITSHSPGLSGGLHPHASVYRANLASRDSRNTPGLAGAATLVETPKSAGMFNPESKFKIPKAVPKRNVPRRRASFLGILGVGAETVRRKTSGLEGIRSRGKALSAAKHTFTKSFAVVSELEKSRLVQDRTSTFASRHFLKNGTFFLLIIVLFFQFTPASFDFPTRHIYQLNSFLETTIRESAVLIDSRDAWFHWHQNLLIGGPAPITKAGHKPFEQETEFGEGRGIIRNLPDESSGGFGNVSCILTENIMQGPMSIIAVQAEVVDCELPLLEDPTMIGSSSSGSSPFSNIRCYNGKTADAIPDGRGSLESYITDPEDVTSGGHIIWVGGNLSVAWQQLEYLRTRADIDATDTTLPFIDHSTRLVTTNLNAYNPELKLYVTVLVEAQFLSTGAVTVYVNVESAHLNSGRFPPSLEFEAVLSALGVVMLLKRLMEARSSRSCSAVTDNRVELVTWAFMLAIIIYDATVRHQVEALRLNEISPWSTTYLNLRPVMESLRNLLTFLSVVAMMIWSPMINELMLFPKMGPMIVAIVETISSRDVKLYLVLFAMFFTIFALSFHITYGTEIEEFAHILSSWEHLFKMPFAEEWQNMDTPNPRPLTYLFYIIFLILAVLMLNLLIAIVTQVYPQKLSISDERWKTLVRDLMEKGLEHDRRSRKKDAGQPDVPGSPNAISSGGKAKKRTGDGTNTTKATLESCLNNKLILEGIDGYNFWRSSVEGSNLSASGQMDQEDHVFRDQTANYLANMSSEDESKSLSLASRAPSRLSGVGGEAWQKLENGLKDQQEKFSMLRAKMNALEESLGGVVEMARETLQINKMLSATTQEVLKKRQGRRG